MKITLNRILLVSIFLFVLDHTVATTERPANDLCDGAIGPLTVGTVVEGSTVNATNDNMGGCGDAGYQDSPGVWFTFIGNGKAVDASTCHGDPSIGNSLSDTQIKVYQGNCTALECVDGNDDFLTGLCGYLSSVVWTAMEGQEYYILVHASGPNAGEFGLVVTELEPPPNDRCVRAIGPLTVGTVVEGTTVNGTNDNMGGCGDAGYQDSPGVWYTFVGAGRTVKASTCPGSSFNTQMKVLKGSCSALECVGGNDYDDTYTCSVFSDYLDASGVVWTADEGTEYYILVHGDEGSAGRFGLVVIEPPINDLCEGAIGPLTAGEVVEGTNVNATDDLMLESCGSANVDHVSFGVWYTFVGNGKTVNVSTCHGDPDVSNSLSDTNIIVYEGNCNALECVDGNDDFDDTGACGQLSSVVWTAADGQEYYILVYGFLRSVGNFGLVVTEVEPPVNDRCEGAIGPLTIGPVVEASSNNGSPDNEVVVQGSTYNATNDFTKQCGSAFDDQQSPGVWYTYIGNGATVNASTCHAVTSFNTQIKVYAGSCSALNCIDGNYGDYTDACDAESSVVWNAAKGQEYYILVHGSEGSVGSFGLVVKELPPNTWYQVGQTLNGQAVRDWFGISVALSANGMILAGGGPGNDGNGLLAGHVRVLSYDTGSRQWIQLGQFLNGKTAVDYFGYSVSLSRDGAIMAAGAPTTADRNGYIQVLAYNRGTDQWSQVGQDVEGRAPGDWFGAAVSLSADGVVVAVGGPGRLVNENFYRGNKAGYVQVLALDNTTSSWTPLGQELNGTDVGDAFGRSVALSSDGLVLAVGADRNDANGQDAGRVQVFAYDSGIDRWEQIGQDLVGEAADDHFGMKVSLSEDGTIVAVGAIWNDGMNGFGSGHVRVFSYYRVNNRWNQIGQDIDGELESDLFGVSVALSADGMIVAAGATHNDGRGGQDSGHVRVFSYDNNANHWNQLGEDLDGERAGDWFGGSVALSGDGTIVAAGATRNNGNGQESGHIRVFGRLESSD